MTDRLAGLKALLRPASSESYARAADTPPREAKETPDATAADIRRADDFRLGKKISYTVHQYEVRGLARVLKTTYREASVRGTLANVPLANGDQLVVRNKRAMRNAPATAEKDVDKTVAVRRQEKTHKS